MDEIDYARWLHHRRVAAMSETEKRLEHTLGLALLDNDDPRYGTHWLVLHPPEGFDLSGEDEWCHPTIRRGEWPHDSGVAIQRLWHKCVELSQQITKHRKTHGKLSVAASAVIVASFVIPMLLVALRLVNLPSSTRSGTMASTSPRPAWAR